MKPLLSQTVLARINSKCDRAQKEINKRKPHTLLKNTNTKFADFPLPRPHKIRAHMNRFLSQ